MKLLKTIAIFLLVLVTSGCWRNQGSTGQLSYQQLELVSATAVDVPRPLEPSGLVMANGELYTVADKDNRIIYRVERNGDTTRLIPAIRFQPPVAYPMDWEGITVDGDGNFHLISEDWARILKVSPEGEASWATPDIMDEVRKAGLYAKNNAGFEGVTWLGPDHWLGAVEREPRGLVEFRRDKEGFQITATLYEHSPFSNALPLLRLPDFSGLDTDGSKVYALFRNAHLVVRLDRVNGTFMEAKAWSYRHIETDPRWAYMAQVYGQAEGLVVDGEDVFIIFDNNLGPRQNDLKDGRPLLIHARFPKAP